MSVSSHALFSNINSLSILMLFAWSRKHYQKILVLEAALIKEVEEKK